MVVLYRRIQILLPSLGTLWMVTQERGMIPLCSPNIPFCAHIVSNEALVVVLRLSFVWSRIVTFHHSQECVHIGKKSVQKAIFTKDYALN